MDETIVCPGCQAQLTLPTLPAGQTVQCPRCRRVFEPAFRGVPASAASAPRRLDAEPDEPDFFVPPRRVLPMEALIGPWFGYLTMLVLAVHAVAFLARAYAEYEGAGFFVRMDFVPRAAEADFRLVNQIELWQVASSWLAVPSFAIWLFLASKNARLLRAGGFSLSPGRILLFFCCPFVNLFIVYQSLQEIWRASDPAKFDSGETWLSASASTLIRLWGVTILAALLSVSGLFPNGGVIWANLLIAAAGALMIAIIYNIQSRQQERYIRLFEDPD